MALINLVRKIMHFNERTGATDTYMPGPQEIPDEDAEHWWIKANSHGAPPVAAGVTLNPKLEAEQALRAAQETLRSATDMAASNLAIQEAHQNALEASEAKVAEMQSRLDQYAQEASARAAEQAAAAAETAKPIEPVVEGESDADMKARAEAEMAASNADGGEVLDNGKRGKRAMTKD